MKKFLMLFTIVAVFILQSNLCAAKNYVYVYPGSWNEFLDELEKICAKNDINFTGEESQSEVFFSVQFYHTNGFVEIAGSSHDIEKYIEKFAVTSYASFDDLSLTQFGKVLGATLFIIGLSDSEIDEFTFQFKRSLYQMSSHAKKFKKKFSIYCKKAAMYIEINFTAENGGLAYSYIQAYRR